MKKFIAILFGILLVFGFFYISDCEKQRQELTQNIVRLHVVANSDSDEDQHLKLLVRDAVISYLEPALSGVQDMEVAAERLSTKLDGIQEVASTVLQRNGSEDRICVSLCKENFDTRHYDTFSLPAGVYSSLRITIGDGDGHNWWCVVFPSLCLPATGEGFRDVAAGAGFSDSISGSLSGKKQYKVRFFFMDVLGKLENFLNMY